MAGAIMAQGKSINENEADGAAIHKYYLDILNCVPHGVYWIDADCKLKGCNHHFVKLLGLNSIKDFTGTPYEQMIRFGHWSEERVEQFHLEDMKAIFAGKPQSSEVEMPIMDDKGNDLHFNCTRVPILDKNKKVTDLVVVLTEIKESTSLPISAKETNESDLIQLEPNKKPYFLMVEDNIVAQKVEESLLLDLNCEVAIANTGEEALSLFEPGKFHVVLMDIKLEDTSGYMVAKKIREKEQGTSFHVPIIALTSFRANDVKYDVHDYFMDGVITKPLTSQQIEQIIQYYIYHKKIQVVGLEAGTPS